jgi:hypothetical protein
MTIGDKIRAQRARGWSFTEGGWNAAIALAADIADTEAAALVAAAYEDAARVAKDWWDCGPDGPATQWEVLRARTPPQAQAVLDAIRAERDRALAEVGPLRRMFHAIVALQKLESECNEADIDRDLPAMQAKFDAAYAEVDAALTEIARITRDAP